MDRLSKRKPPDLEDVFASIRLAGRARPFVIAQLGQSLDGRIATTTGESRYINGDPAIVHLHRLRAHVDAVVVGAETVAVDDPQLTNRRAPGPSPARVVIDPRGRLGSSGKWLARDGARRLLVSAGPAAPDGAELVRLPAADGVIEPRAIVDALASLGLRRILIEGGARTISRFLDAGLLDRLHLLVAPVILGSGKQGIDLAPIASLASALRPKVDAHDLGRGEVLFDCDFG